ncbi:MAG: sporulation membrane protein YtaF [Tepidibacillus sp.]
MISLIILSLAVSLDSFGVGVTYGVRKVRIPIYSILIIALLSASMILLSMQLGVWISYVLSPYMAKWLGSIILICIGVWAIFQVSRHSHEDVEYPTPVNEYQEKKMISIEIKKLGLVIQILKMPMKADIDRSGVISTMEAAFLGIALSLDAFGAGLGAALIGFEPLKTATMIAGMSGLFILVGMKVGLLFSDVEWLKRFTILPGLILIMMGIIKIF